MVQPPQYLVSIIFLKSYFVETNLLLTFNSSIKIVFTDSLKLTVVRQSCIKHIQKNHIFLRILGNNIIHIIYLVMVISSASCDDTSFKTKFYIWYMLCIT